MNFPLYKLHPWHGLYYGENAPDRVTAYIEIVPGETIKFEIDKTSGYRKVDRPQKYSNILPALYGFIPQTYCGSAVAHYAEIKSQRAIVGGDGDPLDILVLTEKNITSGDFILEAIPIGGFRLIDKGEADDKIIAVMAKDELFSKYRDIKDCPETIVKRLKHYFLTYKNLPDTLNPTIELCAEYGSDEAKEIIRLSIQDYKELKEQNEEKRVL